MMDWSAALPTFVVTLREGVEAALVVGIVLAYLNKAGQTHLNRWVYAGIGFGVAASVAIGVILSSVLAALDTANQPGAKITKELLETGFGLLAIALLSWMLIWMTRQARAMKSEVEGAITSALQNNRGAGWGVFGLIGIAVLREGFETVLFIAAKFQQGRLPAIGAVAGLAGATMIGVLLFRLGVKINLRQFFQTMGVLLLLIVSGLVVSMLRHLDRAIGLLAQVNPHLDWCIGHGPSCILGPLVWDLSHILPDRQFPGILLKALFGYTQTLYLAQAIGYVLFLAIVGGLYWNSLTDRRSASRSRQPASEQG